MKRLKKLRLTCLILCLLTLLASCTTYSVNDKTTLPEKTTADDTTAEDTTAEETTLNGDNTAVDVTDIPQIKVPDGATALYSYTLQSSPGYYYAKNENPATDGNENTIPCAIYICESDDATISDSAGSLLLIRDGGWRLFDAITGVATDVNINTDADISDVRLAYDINTKEITGYILINSQNKIAFYNIETGTVYGGFEYDSMDARTCGDYFIAYKENHKEGISEQHDSYVLKISDGSLFNSVPSEHLTIFGSNDVFYFFSSFDLGCGGNMKVYTSDMKAISEEYFLMAVIASDGTLITLGRDDDKTYEIYDSEGNKIYQSREYDDVLFIGSDGKSTDIVVVVDGGKMKLIDCDGSVLQIYCDWQDSYYFHWLISGYNESKLLSSYQDYYLGYSVITNPGDEDPVYKDEKLPENQPPTLYLIVENTADGKAREYFYIPENGTAGAFDVAYVGGYSKPVLYLYPEKTCDVSVVFEHPEQLTVTYPSYNDGWNVSVMADGTISDARGRKYYAFYWEESGFVPTDFSTGFCVKAEDASEFLENKLDQIGLTEREANEFIIYWLPVMQNNGTSLVYFELTANRESYNTLQITPQPDSMLRMAMHIKAVDAPVKVTEQKLPHFERKGFAVVEWGGVIYK